MPLHLTESQLTRLRSGKPLKAHARLSHVIGEMSRTEQAYAGYLDRRKLAGEIADYRFEPLNLRLAKKTYYRVDFLVVLPDGLIELVETKGTSIKTTANSDRQEVPFFKDDGGLTKIKIAAKAYPWFQFVLTYRLKSGEWKRVEY